MNWNSVCFFEKFSNAIKWHTLDIFIQNCATPFDEHFLQVFFSFYPGKAPLVIFVALKQDISYSIAVFYR